MSDDIVHRRMPKRRKVTICIVLAMAFSNSVILIVTVIRPVPQFATTGVLMQLGARTEATLARRYISTAATMGPEQDDGWLSPSKRQAFNFDGSYSYSDSPPAYAPDSRDVKEQQPSLLGSVPPLQVRSPCGDPCGDGFFEEPKPKPKPKPVHKPKPIQQQFVDPTAYIDMVVGLLGVCIMRVDGVTACSDPTFTPNYRPVFEQANLDKDVLTKLPFSPGAASLSILFSAVLYSISVIIFGLMLIPPFNVGRSATGKRIMDSRHQNALAIVAVIITIALFLALIPTFTLREAFQKAIKAIPAYNENLQAKLGSAFTQLYVICVLGGLILVQCLLLISEDLRFPWWYTQASIRRNPFETTEPGLTLTAGVLKRDRLDRRFHELGEPPAFAIPAFQTPAEAAARRWEEREKALQEQQASVSGLRTGNHPGTGHATSPETGNV